MAALKNVKLLKIEQSKGKPLISSSDPSSQVPDDLQPRKRSSSFEWLPPHLSELRVILLGNSWSERSSVGNLILGETKFNSEDESEMLKVKGSFKEKDIVLINTPDLLHPNISEDKLNEHVKNCVRLSSPGPHVFLLVLKPEDFTEEQEVKLCKVLQLFSDQSFDHSLVLISSPREESPDLSDQPLIEMISMCSYRSLKQNNLEQSELVTLLGQITEENKGKHVICKMSEDEDVGLVMKQKSVSESIKPALNLVMFGSRGASKSSVVEAILGQTDLESVSNSSKCVKHLGEVRGRLVTLVELPAMYERNQKVVMDESLKSISLCDPEGVHAFILVLPLGPLTDEDKIELEIIQNTFSSRVNDFTMILFTVESDPRDPDVVHFVTKNRDIQELCQSCGGRYVVLNVKDNQKIPELLHNVDEMVENNGGSYNTEMFEDMKREHENLRRKYNNLREEYMYLKRKHEEDLKMKNIEIDQEKTLRARQLKEKDESINKERVIRKKEREEQERKWKKREETQRQEWRKKLEASEREQRGNTEEMLEQCRKEMRIEHEKDKQNLEEVTTSLKNLQEYNHNIRIRIYTAVLLFVLLLYFYVTY